MVIPTAIPVTDNAMYPLLNTNMQVGITMGNKDCNSGDIVAVYINDNKENMLIRTIVFEGDYVILKALNNKEYEDLRYLLKEVTIIGKVHKRIENI